MKLKICGMRDADNIREVAKLSPDFMGFIFYPMSKRYVGEDFVMPEISSDIKRVGVFVNEPLEKVLEKVKKYKLDLVQLHGDESAEYCAELFHPDSYRDKLWKSCELIKAFGIDEHFDFSVLNEYENYCDYFLFDTKAKEYGGSGRSFDFGLLKKYGSSKPFFISGGLDLAVIPRLMSQVPRPFSIDVNSKFETEPGLKDINKLSLLITNMRITNS